MKLFQVNNCSRNSMYVVAEDEHGARVRALVVKHIRTLRDAVTCEVTPEAYCGCSGGTDELKLILMYNFSGHLSKETDEVSDRWVIIGVNGVWLLSPRWDQEGKNE